MKQIQNVRDSDSSKSLLDSRNKPFMPNHLKNKFRKTIQSNAENEKDQKKKKEAEKKRNKRGKPTRNQKHILKKNKRLFQGKSRWNNDEDNWKKDNFSKKHQGKVKQKVYKKSERFKTFGKQNQISNRLKKKINNLIDQEYFQSSSVQTNETDSAKNKEQMLGMRVEGNNLNSRTSSNSIPFVSKQAQFKKPLSSVSSAWEYVENEYEDQHQKRELKRRNRIQSEGEQSLGQNSKSERSFITTKKNKKWGRLKNKIKDNRIPNNFISPIENKDYSESSYLNENIRKSYRTRESILSVDRKLSKDPGKLSHHMRQIFQYLTTREVTLGTPPEINRRKSSSSNQPTRAGAFRS